MALVLSATPALAGPDGSIDMFPYGIDAQGNPTTVDTNACQATVTDLSGFLGKLTVGVYARLSGATLAGISGAEFYLEGVEAGAGLPADWTKAAVYPTGTVQVGQIAEPVGTDPVVRRLNHTWSDVSGPASPNCQKDPLVEIARVDFSSAFGFATNFPNDYWIRIVAGDPPGSPAFPCPLLVLCDYPAFTKVCVDGGAFLINPVGESCAVAVESTSWGAMKELYR